MRSYKQGAGMKRNQNLSPPTVQQLETELKRKRDRSRSKRLLRSTVSTLIVAAAVTVLVSTFLLPVLKIYGTSMAPALDAGNIVIAIRSGSYKRGDVIAFYYNNKVLIKRVIAFPGEWVDIDADGNVSVDGHPLEEFYLAEKDLGECDIELPYQVPDGRYFVMGDHRSISSDSRNSTVGCVAEEQIVWKLVFRIWPLGKMGSIE